jgi:hypothetical protein
MYPTKERGTSDGKPIYHIGVGPNTSIQDNLVLLAIKEIKEEIDEKMSVPMALEQNKLIWAKTMMQIKPMQDLLASFTDQVKKIIEKELRNKSKKHQRFMNTNRPPDESL